MNLCHWLFSLTITTDLQHCSFLIRKLLYLLVLHHIFTLMFLMYVQKRRRGLHRGCGPGTTVVFLLLLFDMINSSNAPSSDSISLLKNDLAICLMVFGLYCINSF